MKYCRAILRRFENSRNVEVKNIDENRGSLDLIESTVKTMSPPRHRANLDRSYWTPA
jgi:hypothetical protein